MCKICEFIYFVGCVHCVMLDVYTHCNLISYTQCIQWCVTCVFHVFTRCIWSVYYTVYWDFVVMCIHSVIWSVYTQCFLECIFVCLHRVIWMCIHCVLWCVYWRFYTVYFDCVFLINYAITQCKKKNTQCVYTVFLT